MRNISLWFVLACACVFWLALSILSWWLKKQRSKTQSVELKSEQVSFSKPVRCDCGATSPYRNLSAGVSADEIAGVPRELQKRG